MTHILAISTSSWRRSPNVLLRCPIHFSQDFILGVDIKRCISLHVTQHSNPYMTYVYLTWSIISCGLSHLETQKTCSKFNFMSINFNSHHTLHAIVVPLNGYASFLLIDYSNIYSRATNSHTYNGVYSNQALQVLRNP